MKVKFDSLNRFEEPELVLCNPGSTYSDGTVSNVVAILPDVSDLEFVYNFNSPSEMNFRISKVKRDDDAVNEHVFSVFKAVQNRRLIYVQDIGYFVITSIKEGLAGNGQYKDVTAISAEYEIQNKKVPYIEDGTYIFSNDEVHNVKGLLQTIVETLPFWTIGDVDSAVASKYRTFEDVDVDTNCLAFMLESMQDAYECIFIFDTINRIIHIYDQANYVVQTDIHITKDDLINELNISEDSDDVYTALSVFGDEDMTISAINPIGTNVVYNFDHYLSWMSGSLGSKVLSWEVAVEDAREYYYDNNLQLYEKLNAASILQSNLDKLKIQLDMYRRCRENIVAATSTVPEAEYSAVIATTVAGFNPVIVANGGIAIQAYPEIRDTLNSVDALITTCEGEWDGTTASLDSLNADIAILRGRIETTHEDLLMENYFTSSELEELLNYIYEGSYTDQYVVITPSMTYEEQFAQMKILYDRTLAQLEKISVPTREFTADVENFIFVKDFEPWADQLETGCLINVELETDDVAPLFLLKMNINYEDHKLSLTFGNRFNRFDTKSLFENVLGKISKSANTLNYVKDILYPVKQGQLNQMQEAIQTSRDLTMGNTLSAIDEQVLIDGSGYTGRKMLNNGTYDPRQVKIIGKNIVFTDDAWDTCKVAIGELILGNGETTYGINCDTLIGDFIIGNNLRIVDANGNDLFTIIDGRVQSQVGATIDGLTANITSITQTANDLSVRIDTLENTEIDHVTTSTGYTFNQDGLTISKSGEEITNLLDNTGMYVQRSDEDILTANADGVNAINLTARQYFNIGKYSRFEDYSNGTDTKRTACFHIDG